jgi:hypothetical protein
VHPFSLDAVVSFSLNWEGPPVTSLRLNRRALREHSTDGGAMPPFTNSENCRSL